ncbi:DegT/DnrJ/EryC1/StrS family aminotransferase [Occallatibacter savannae]|uniref:DegT/DnrJ/EryC1/StrS family aminotransferase n=1 Tax=Occallatibacter savannae TaxID=1002691 RepID=UPI000D69226C|nr:DegT/DnrJ/EryC1/StrS family aminotransferase [Occallatibacter savannae]
MIPLSSPDITEAEIAAVTAVLRTPQLCMGPELDAFEKAMAEYHSVPHAVAVSSGTAGLQMALLTLAIGAGHEVIVPSFAFIAVANAVAQVGATPVFADVDELTLNLTPESVKKVITPRTRAIIAVHTFGIPADMIGLRELASAHNLVIIEDACEAIGAKIGDKRAGAFGDLSIFGFYPNKQITTGEGGAVLAHSQIHAQRLEQLRNQGRARQPHPANSPDLPGTWDIGFNYRLSDIACALGRVQLQRIDEILSKRRQAAERYHRLLEGINAIELPPIALPGIEISWFVYVIRLGVGVDRTRLRECLAADGVATATYFEPIHQQPAWSRFNRQPMPVAESVGPRTLALPFFTRITEEEQQEVATSLRQALLQR